MHSGGLIWGEKHDDFRRKSRVDFGRSRIGVGQASKCNEGQIHVFIKTMHEIKLGGFGRN